MNGQTVDEAFYAPLISIIGEEGEKIKQNLPHFAPQDLSSAADVLLPLRNSFYENSSNQNMVAENEEFRNTLVRFTEILLKDLFPTLSDGKETKEGVALLESSFYDTVSLCITSFVNMMAGNSDVRKIMWPYIQSLIYPAVSLPSPNVSHKGAALFHQFLVEEDLKEEILKSNLTDLLIPPLLKSYLIEGPHSCFPLFCLEALVNAPEAVSSTWEKLPLKESLLLLDILTTLVQKETASIPLSTIHFIQEVYKKDADRIFALHDDRNISEIPVAITRVASFLSCAASSDLFRSHLQKDRSLLISSVYLLRGITDIGSSSTNIFTRVQNSAADSKLDSHPVFGFKSDLIRFIAALVFRNKDNQDKVREIDGIQLLLENSQYDDTNPFIREASIFALRNLVEGNSVNQDKISSLQIVGVAENEVLDELGLSVTFSDGKVSHLERETDL